MTRKTHEKHPVSTIDIPWETTINSVPTTFYIPTYHSIPEQGSDASVVLNLNGIGEGPYSASVAPSILGENIISPILPFQGQLEMTPLNLERISVEVPEVVAREALRLINEHRRRDQHLTSMAVIGRSQGGAPAIRSMTENPELFGNLGLIMPFGLNRDQLGDTAQKRRHEAIKRLAFAATRANPFDVGNARSTREVIGYFLSSFRDKTLFPAFDAAMTFDLVDELKELAETKKVGVFVGKHDPLFTADELTANLAGSKVEIITVPGTHATPGSRPGRHNLHKAYDWVTKQAV